MTLRDARLLTLIAQAVLTMELTMREVFDALSAKLDANAAEIARIATLVADLKAQAVTNAAAAAELAALGDVANALTTKVDGQTSVLIGVV